MSCYKSAIYLQIISKHAAFYARDGIRVLRDFVENQARSNPQTVENILPKYVGALLQVQEEGLYQISNGGGTEVQNLFGEHAFRDLLNTYYGNILYICAIHCFKLMRINFIIRM